MNKPIRCTTHFHACDCREYEFEMVKKENEELISWVLKIRDTIEKNHPEYFDDWVGEFVHSPAVCLERVYLFLKEEVDLNLSEVPNSSKEGV